MWIQLSELLKHWLQLSSDNVTLIDFNLVSKKIKQYIWARFAPFLVLLSCCLFWPFSQTRDASLRCILLALSYSPFSHTHTHTHSLTHSFIHSFISCVPAHHFNIRLHVLLSVLRLQTNQQRGVMMVVKHVKLDVYHSQLTIWVRRFLSKFFHLSLFHFALNLSNYDYDYPLSNAQVKMLSFNLVFVSIFNSIWLYFCVLSHL